MVDDVYLGAAKGIADFNLKALEAARANVNAAFDYASAMMQAGSLSEAVELTSAHARRQFEALVSQTKDLSNVAQQVANEAAAPVKASVDSLEALIVAGRIVVPSKP